MRIKRKPTVLVAGLLTTLVTLVTVPTVLTVREQQRKDAVADAEEACSLAYAARLSLRADMDAAESLLAETAGKVADAATHETLTTTYETTRTLSGPKDVPVLDHGVPHGADTKTVRTTARECRSTATDADATRDRLAADMAAVHLSHEQWLWDASYAEAQATIDAAQALLAESEGKVLDDTLRGSLMAALVDITAVVPPEGPPTTASDLATMRQILDTAATRVRAAQEGVAQSRAAWQAEQDARAAAARKQGSGKATAPKTGTPPKVAPTAPKKDAPPPKKAPPPPKVTPQPPAPPAPHKQPQKPRDPGPPSESGPWKSI